jgi:hypothetical protein
VLQRNADNRDVPFRSVIWNEYECIALRIVDVEDDNRAFAGGRGELAEAFGSQEALEGRDSSDFVDEIVPLDRQFRMIGGGIFS